MKLTPLGENIELSVANMSTKPDIDIDEKKRKRKISNRESARRSRIRRQKHVHDLINEKAQLERMLNHDKQTYEAIRRRYVFLESENKVLRAKTLKLTQYLNYLHQILASYEETDDQINHNYQPVLNPWQVNGPSQPIAASGILEK